MCPFTLWRTLSQLDPADHQKVSSYGGKAKLMGSLADHMGLGGWRDRYSLPEPFSELLHTQCICKTGHVALSLITILALLPTGLPQSRQTRSDSVKNKVCEGLELPYEGLAAREPSE